MENSEDDISIIFLQIVDGASTEFPLSATG
jgi:hypothetical protein